MHARLLPLMLALFCLPSCTQGVQDNLDQTGKDFSSFDYGRLTTLFGIDQQLFPSYYDRQVEQENKLCFHDNAVSRDVTYNGVSDRYAYRECPISPPPQPPAPQRLLGR